MIHWPKHHVVPKHMGGPDDKGNLLKCNVAMHAFLHKQLWAEHGLVEDYLAWNGLLGLIGKEEIMRLVPRFRGHKHSEESKRKIGLAGIGRVFSADSKRKISLAMQRPRLAAHGHVNNPWGRRGKPDNHAS